MYLEIKSIWEWYFEAILLSMFFYFLIFLKYFLCLEIYVSYSLYFYGMYDISISWCYHSIVYQISFWITISSNKEWALVKHGICAYFDVWLVSFLLIEHIAIQNCEYRKIIWNYNHHNFYSRRLCVSIISEYLFD